MASNLDELIQSTMQNTEATLKSLRNAIKIRDAYIEILDNKIRELQQEG